MLGLLILLTGCRLDVDVATTVAEDGSGTVVVTVHADDELLAAAPGLVADLRLDDLTAAGWTVDGPVSAAGDGTRLVLTKPFASPEQANLVLAEVGAPLQVALAQAREFALVRTTVTGAVTGVDLDAFADAELVQALGGEAAARRAGHARAARIRLRPDRRVHAAGRGGRGQRHGRPGHRVLAALDGAWRR